VPAADVRCYGELNDFLPEHQRGRALRYRFGVPGSVKDALESLGVPHPEIDLLLVNGEPADFDRLLADGDRVAAYPLFRRLDISAVSAVHLPLPDDPRFALDGHLGKLARYLRLLGFDATHRPQADDQALARQAADQDRILLTRDLGLLKRRAVRRGYRVRSTDPRAQLTEVVRQFSLAGRCRPFTRCLVCGEGLAAASPEEAAGRIPPGVAAHQSAFRVCPDCGQVYWPGSHHRRLSALVEEALASAAGAGP